MISKRWVVLVESALSDGSGVDSIHKRLCKRRHIDSLLVYSPLVMDIVDDYVPRSSDGVRLRTTGFSCPSEGGSRYVFWGWFTTVGFL